MSHTPTLTIALGLAALLLVAGCPGGEEPALVSVPLQVAAAEPGSFTTAAGYDVELGAGVVVLGELHFHEPKAVEQASRWAPALRAPWGLAGPAAAWAHPGHDMSGDVAGEWVGITYVDLAAGPRELGEGSFYEGPYETASLLLQQDGEDGDAGLAPGSPAVGHTLAVAGTADDGGGPIPFEFVVDHPKTILGVPFETEIEAGDLPVVTLTVDVAEILGHLDFAAADTDGDGTVTGADADAVNPLLFGLESNLAYRYEIE